MPALLAGFVVFVCSAAVLTVEILGGRLMAPYVGVSLETYTSVIGIVLAGIASGAWAGGWIADRVDARRLVGPTIIIGGALTLATVPIVRSVGDASSVDVGVSAAGLALAAFFLPAFALSAVSPMIVKLQLHSLDRTGNTVGRLSAIGTLGGLVGVFVTGFVLVENAPTRTVIYAVGGALVVLGVALGVRLSRRDGVALVVLVIAATGVGITTASAEEPCDVESAYYCLRVERDFTRPTGRTLWLDDLEHSYVDLADPTYLQFDYVNWFAEVVDANFPAGSRLDALHIGGGGFTFPRWIDATRPGSRSTVLEIDPAVVTLAKRELGLHESDRLRVDVGDARLAIRGRPDASVDLAVGDAFGGLSVPWHLTTTEFLDEVQRVLRPGGIYVANVIDGPPYLFARAEVATLERRFRYVAVLTSAGVLEGVSSNNIVLVASDRPLTDPEGHLVQGRALGRFVDDAPVITDDRAPIDQWLARGRL